MQCALKVRVAQAKGRANTRQSQNLGVDYGLRFQGMATVTSPEERSTERMKRLDWRFGVMTNPRGFAISFREV